MRAINKILVPTDFSPASNAALDAALAFAKKFEASIVLMHAYQVPIYAYPSDALVTVSELSAQAEWAAMKALEAAATAQRAGVAIQTALYLGAPCEQILRAASDHDVGLIVMGSRGLRGLPRALLGSTTERVVRYASVPVMTLHGPPDPAFEATGERPSSAHT
jgi:nucleotide-binding universal stress UspA family protein